MEGGEAAPAVRPHHGDELGAERALPGQAPHHGEEEARAPHGQDGPGQGAPTPGRVLAEGPLHRADDVGRGEEPLEVLPAEDAHQAFAGLRLIMRLTCASSTTSPR